MIPTSCISLARRLAAAALPLLVAAAPALAQTNAAAPAVVSPAAAATRAADPDPVLISNSVAQVRKSDYDLELMRLPADVRGGFGTSKRRISELLSRMLVTKTLAAQAYAAKLDQDPEVVARYKTEVERFYAGARQAMVERAAAAEFDAKRPQMEARARELYVANLKQFDVPEQVSASHILFKLGTHSKDEGLKLAQDARAQIVAGADFNALAVMISEDSGAALSRGKIGYFTRDQMDPAFTEAAFSLAKVGDLSEPVLSQFGWHLIRLDGRKSGGPQPYDAVRLSILTEMKLQYVNEKREALIAAIDADPRTTVDEAAVDTLFVKSPDVQQSAEEEGGKGDMKRPTADERREAREKRQTEKQAPKN